MTFPEHAQDGTYIGRPDHADAPVLEPQPIDAPYAQPDEGDPVSEVDPEQIDDGEQAEAGAESPDDEPHVL
jgi:hypothetical protein